METIQRIALIAVLLMVAAACVTHTENGATPLLSVMIAVAIAIVVWQQVDSWINDKKQD